MCQASDLGAPFITNYGPRQYQASTQNWAAAQDLRGVMYFGNSTGILAFDGQRWQTIPTPDNIVVRALTLGHDGTIYYGSIGDFGFLSAAPTGKVTAVSLRGAIPPAERDFNDVWQVESGKDGIYFMTRHRIFRLQDGKITVLQARFVDSSACVLNGTVFFADLLRGVCLIEGNTVVPVPQLAGVFNGKRIVLEVFGAHELLVARLTGDLLRLDLSALWDERSGRYLPGRLAPKTMVHAFPSKAAEFLKADEAFLGRLRRIGPEAFALTTIKAGLILFDRAGTVTHVWNKQAGLPDNAVNGLFVDRSQNLWATTDIGIAHIESSVPQSMFGASHGLEGYAISARFHKGRLYVGTMQKLFRLMPAAYSLRDTAPAFRALKGSPDEIWQLLEAGGDLLAATGRGLFLVHDDSVSRVSGSPDNTMLCMGTSRLWSDHLFVGRPEGLEVFKRSAGQWRHLGAVEGLTENIRSIREDPAGNLWLSTDAKGLVGVRFTSKTPTKVDVFRFGMDQGLPGTSNLRSLFEGTEQYVCSPQGLFQATAPAGNSGAMSQTRFARSTSFGEGLIDPTKGLFTMVSDDRGGHLFSTEEGILWMVPGEGGRPRPNHNPFQGIPRTEWEIYLHPDGSVWLLGEGLFRVDPWAAKDYGRGFSVLIRKVLTKSKRLLFEGTYGTKGPVLKDHETLFQGSDSREAIPELPYGENALSFEFSATFFEKPGTTRFQYLLEGFDKAWSDWGTSPFKEYTNIPEGTYRFRVRAKNLYGALGQETHYAFRVHPPWFRRGWAYLGYLLGLVGSVWGVVRWRVRALKVQNELLEIQVADRTRTVEQQRLDLEQANANLLGLNQDLLNLNRDMAVALEEVQALRGFIPICAYCKEIRDDQGYWAQLEAYISRHTGARFSHGICPKCQGKVKAELEQLKKDDPFKP